MVASTRESWRDERHDHADVHGHPTLSRRVTVSPANHRQPWLPQARRFVCVLDLQGPGRFELSPSWSRRSPWWPCSWPPVGVAASRGTPVSRRNRWRRPPSLSRCRPGPRRPSRSFSPSSPPPGRGMPPGRRDSGQRDDPVGDPDARQRDQADELDAAAVRRPGRQPRCGNAHKPAAPPARRDGDCAQRRPRRRAARVMAAGWKGRGVAAGHVAGGTPCFPSEAVATAGHRDDVLVHRRRRRAPGRPWQHRPAGGGAPREAAPGHGPGSGGPAPDSTGRAGRRRLGGWRSGRGYGQPRR
jgi:hypothetical protein